MAPQGRTATSNSASRTSSQVAWARFMVSRMSAVTHGRRHADSMNLSAIGLAFRDDHERVGPLHANAVPKGARASVGGRHRPFHDEFVRFQTGHAFISSRWKRVQGLEAPDPELFYVAIPGHEEA